MMMHRRIRLTALMMVILFGVLASADAGGRRRRFHCCQQQPTNAFQQPTNAFQQPANAFQQPANAFQQPTNAFQQPANAFQQPTNAFQQPANALQQAAPLSSGTDGVCPMYVWMSHGDGYCSWYSIQCAIDGQHPVSYDAACDAGPKNPCDECPYIPGLIRSFAGNQHQVDPSLKDGYTTHLAGGFLPRGTVRPNGEITVKIGMTATTKIKMKTLEIVNEVIKDPGADFYFHVVSVLTGPVHVGNAAEVGDIRHVPYRKNLGKILIHAGYEVAPPVRVVPNADEVKEHPSGSAGLRLVKFQGNEYTVVMKKIP